jgi:hypothetical protein
MNEWLINRFQNRIDDLVFKTLKANQVYIESLNLQLDEQVGTINDLIEERSKYLDIIETMNYDIEMLRKEK